ncbi:rab GTPase-binding effector protein 1 isoform X1 [Cimex lectularius]|uniref:FYVE-type domain-containing protein n=1 Tax=Cimex lectularius TaxID=79782 RepID=A0A8I6TJ74_CIMLE|nr:rab GTPase-binding effector protein 1 isoform X1 [Cimex lectularius]
METSNEKGVNDNNIDLSVEALLAQIVELKSEKQTALEEFGAQRAKLKDLFMQKEDEVNLLRKELDLTRMQVTEAGLELEAKELEGINCQAELTSLQQLLKSTLEESSRYEEEIQQLKNHIEELESDLSNLKANQSSSSMVSDISLGNPGTMFTTFARKVKSQLGATDLGHTQVDSLEENMRKAKEDAEVLKSVVVPLEEEITALKNKLRETDDQLQKYLAKEEQMAKEKVNKLIDIGSPSEAPKTCMMCSNYETQLVQAQIKTSELERQMAVMSKTREELEKEMVFRKQLEEKWAECKEEHKTQVTELQNEVKTIEGTLVELKKTFNNTSDKLKRQFEILIEERKSTEEKLERLQIENENLVGKRNASATELQIEKINLPDNVEKLQEMWLEQREQLIQARVGQERCEENLQTWECLYKASEDKQKHQEITILELQKDLERKQREIQKENHLLEKAIRDKNLLEGFNESLNMQVAKLEEDKKKLEQSESELRNRLASLQTGLENGEAVQKDFVMLSQSLQKELERLRGQNNVLRWEHEEDVLSCRGCEQPFKLVSKKKINCRHCGRIFCINCLNHKVTSGPNQRESRVCQVCHTLLNSETAPYFSTEPPQQTK